MTSHNTYFDGGVQSLGFERMGQRATVGVLASGTWRFDTGSPERMTIVSGEVDVRIADGEWRAYPRGTTFDVPASTSFEIRTGEPSAYLCEFL